MDLPETSLLVAFEAVARHRNFRKAADELHLTPSAISHRLKTLESRLGQPLLIRTTRNVEPTEAGAAFFTRIAHLLDDLDDACCALRETVQSVTIVTTDSVATCWLIQRLPNIAEDTDVELRVHTRPAGFEFDAASAELAIVYGQAEMWPTGDPLLIAAEVITPVCSPAIADGTTHPDDLWGLPLLGDRNLHINWSAFAEQTGTDPTTSLTIRPSTTFNHSHLALRAAADGQGVALASSPLADDALSRSELVMPIRQSVTTGNGYYLVSSPTRSTERTQRVREAFRTRLRHTTHAAEGSDLRNENTPTARQSQDVDGQR